MREHPARRNGGDALCRPVVRAGWVRRKPLHRQRYRRARPVVARGAMRFTPGRRADVTLTVNHYKEDSNRARVTKQMCHHDPAARSAVCRIALAFEAGNMRGTLGGILGEWGALLLDLGDGTPDGSFAGFPLPPALINTGTDVNPGSRCRATCTRLSPSTTRPIRPTKRRHARVLVRLRSDDLDEQLAGYQETSLPVPHRLQLDVADGCRTTVRRSPAFGGGIPISEMTTPLLGSLGGNIRDAASFRATTTSRTRKPINGRPKCDCRRSSTGPINFQLGVFYFDCDDNTNYYDRDERARLLGAGDRAVHAVPRLGTAVLHQCHADGLAQVDAPCSARCITTRPRR